MKLPDDRAVRALASLENDPHFVEVLRWLREALAEQDRANRSLVGPELHQGQGKAQTLAALIDQSKDASANVRRILAAEATQRRRQLNPGSNAI